MKSQTHAHEPPELCRHCGCSFLPASARGECPGPCHGGNPNCDNLIALKGDRIVAVAATQEDSR